MESGEAQPLGERKTSKVEFFCTHYYGQKNTKKSEYVPKKMVYGKASITTHKI